MQFRSLGDMSNFVGTTLFLYPLWVGIHFYDNFVRIKGVLINNLAPMINCLGVVM